MNASPLFLQQSEEAYRQSAQKRQLQSRKRSRMLLLLSRAVIRDLRDAGWPAAGLCEHQSTYLHVQRPAPAIVELYRLLALTAADGTAPFTSRILIAIRANKWDDLPAPAFKALPEDGRLSLLRIDGIDLSGDDFLGRDNGLLFVSMLQRAFFRERAGDRLEAAFGILGIFGAQQASFHWQLRRSELVERIRGQLNPCSQRYFDRWHYESKDAPMPKLFTYIRQKGWNTWSGYPGLLTESTRAEIAFQCGFSDITRNGAAALVDAAVFYLQRLERCKK